MSEFEELEPDYDTDEGEQKPEPSQRVPPSLMTMSTDSSQSHRAASTDPLIKQESISMETLSGSTHPSRQTSMDEVLSGYTTTTTDGASDLEMIDHSKIVPTHGHPARKSGLSRVNYGASGDMAKRLSKRDLHGSEVIANQAVIEGTRKAPIDPKPKSPVTLQVPDRETKSGNEPASSGRYRKKSSAASVEIDIQDLENDPDFGEDFNAMIRQRKRSFRSGKRGKSQRRSQRLSNRSREGRRSDVGE